MLQDASSSSAWSPSAGEKKIRETEKRTEEVEALSPSLLLLGEDKSSSSSLSERKNLGETDEEEKEKDKGAGEADKERKSLENSNRTHPLSSTLS